MRQERTVQATIFEVFAGHEIGCELKAISQWLDRQSTLVSLVAGDLRRHGVRETGRRGLPAETVLRCALLKQQRQLSYEELAFHLEDSASFRAFARLPLAWSPKKSVLHQTISAIRPETWEAVNRAVLASAKQDKLESGATVRIDSTVTAALMHERSDSALLWDGVRLMTRLLRQAYALVDAPYPANLQAGAKAGTVKPNDDTWQNPSYAFAAGGVISTADDLAIWMRTWSGASFLMPTTSANGSTALSRRTQANLSARNMGMGSPRSSLGRTAFILTAARCPATTRSWATIHSMM